MKYIFLNLSVDTISVFYSRTINEKISLADKFRLAQFFSKLEMFHTCDVVISKVAFFKKWANLCPLFCLFLFFSNKQYNFYNQCENLQISIQYMATGFEPATLRA